MKQLLTALTLLVLVALPHDKAFASHFSCTTSGITETGATVTVRTTQPGIFATQSYIKVVDVADDTMANTISPQSSIDQSADTVVRVFEYLDPGKTYKAVVYDNRGIFIEEIKGCTVTTKGGTTPTTSSNSSGIAFKISVQDKTSTSARITAQSLLSFQVTGNFDIRRYTGQASGQSQPFCTGSTFDSGVPVQCVVTGLTPNTRYLAIVVANGPDGRQYSTPTEFTTLAQSTTTGQTQSTSTTQNTGSPTLGSGNGGSPTLGQDSGIPMQTTGVASNENAGGLLQIKLKNPLKVDNIGDAITFFLNTLIKIAIPFIVVFFIWAGLKFILAQGKPEELKKARMMFWYTIIGTLLILGAWTIANAIIGTVNSIIN